MQITLLTKESLDSLKFTLLKFLTSVFNENDLSNKLNTFASDVNNVITTLLSNTKSAVFEPVLQEQIKEKLSIDYFVGLLLQNFDSLSSQVKQSDLKTQLLALLKKLAFICVNKETVHISP